jgi:uncharacterized membrane protein YidH (DUF202 family)
MSITPTYTHSPNRFGTDVFVTHNIHKNSWTNNSESITKEQFSLRPEQVDLFLNGQFPPNHIIAEHQKHDGAYATNITDSDEICNLSSSIYNLIHEKQLVPTVRCSYYHNKYISPHDPGLQVSLDTDMTFVNEQQVRTHRKWENLSKDICELVTMQDERTVQRFPFSILEVKQQDQTGNENTPEWLGQLIQGQLVHEVPFFSSYVHGVSCFYRERLPLLPWWLNELTKDIRRPDQNDSIHEIHSAQPITTFSNNNALPPPPSNGNNYPNINFNDETKDQIIDMVSSPSKEAGSQPLNRNGYSLGNEKVTDSSCTLTDDSLSRYGHHHADSTTGLLSQGAFSKSNIVSRIKNMKEQYYNNVFDDPENGQDDITMLTWLRAKLTGKDPSAPQASAQEIMPKKGRTKKKIEPKVFFANERTFINWLQFSGLMLSLSLGLINFGDSLSKSSGGLFIVIAMFMAGYSLLRFQYRSWQIRMRSNSRFDDMYGPAVLCFVLIISLIVNLALRVNQPLPTNPNLFGQDSISDSVPFTNQTTGVNVTNNVATNKHDTNVSRNQGIKNVTITPHVKPIKANEDEDEED